MGHRKNGARGLPSIRATADESDYVYGTRIPWAPTPSGPQPRGARSTTMYHFYSGVGG